MTNKLIKYFEAQVSDDLSQVTFRFDEISYFSIDQTRHVTEPFQIEYHDCIFNIYPLRLINSDEEKVMREEWKSFCPE